MTLDFLTKVKKFLSPYIYPAYPIFLTLSSFLIVSFHHRGTHPSPTHSSHTPHVFATNKNKQSTHKDLYLLNLYVSFICMCFVEMHVKIRN